jgi:hypothetical protein
MCAMFRDRMPDDENVSPAGANRRRFEATAERQRTAMWQMISGLPAGRVWFFR